MKKILYYFVISSFIFNYSCYREAYVLIPSSINTVEKDTLEQIDINPKNFFYLKLEEYFETFDYQLTQDDVSRNNEASASLYRSVHRDPTEGESNIVEEKYMYIENYDTDLSSGRILYFKTARLVNNRKLKQYYTDTSRIHINTTIKVSLGYWYRQDIDTTYHLLMTNGSKNYQVVAKGENDRITFFQISHPNVDENSRETGYDQLIKVKSVMNVQQDSGLVFYRNIPSETSPERAIIFNESFKINSILFVYRDKKNRNVISHGKSFIETDCGGFAEGRNNYLKSYIIPSFDRKLFGRDKKVAKRYDKREEMRNPE